LEQKVRSLIGVSLILEGEILGVLYLNSIYPGHFSNAQITSMVSTLADQAAIAIDNARLRREQLTALQEIGSDIAHITSELNLNLLLDEIVKHACELLHNASNGTIQLFDESSNELVVEAHIGDVIKSEYANVRLKMGEGLTGWVAQNRKTARVGNINKDERCLAYLAGTNSEVAVPLLYDDELIGVLNVEHQKYGAFSEEDQKLLEVIGNQAAIAINNARLYSQLAEKNQHLDRKIRDLKAVYKVSQQLTAAVRMSEQDVLALIHEQVSQLMDAENMYIALYDEATDTVRFPLVFVDSQPWPVAPRSGGKGRTEWILKHREPIFIETRDESVAWYEKYGQEYIGEPFASWIGVPMMAGDKVLGVIATYHKTRDYVYTTDDQEVLELMASQAAIVLQNARMWEAMQKLSEDLSGGAALDVE
jgi:GAF domain-containing protein